VEFVAIKLCKSASGATPLDRHTLRMHICIGNLHAKSPQSLGGLGSLDRKSLVGELRLRFEFVCFSPSQAPLKY